MVEVIVTRDQKFHHFFSIQPSGGIFLGFLINDNNKVEGTVILDILCGSANYDEKNALFAVLLLFIC